MSTTSGLLQSHVHGILHATHNFRHPVAFTHAQSKDLSGAPAFEKVFVTSPLICTAQSQSPSPQELLGAFPKHLCSQQTSPEDNEDLLDGAETSLGQNHNTPAAHPVGGYFISQFACEHPT